MLPVTEATIIIVGFGTGAFLLALGHIMNGAVKRRIDYHMVRVKAMELRNEYVRQVIAAAPPPRGSRSPQGSSDASRRAAA